MNLGEVKDRVRKLLDEHSSGGTVERDQDIEQRLNALIDNQQKRMAALKRVIKEYPIPLVQGASPKAYPMPNNFYRPHRLWADNKQIGRGTWRGKSLILPGDESREIVVEYFAFPASIGEDTPDDHDLEIDEDAAVCLCYFVAADIALVDLVIDSSKILAVATRLLDQLYLDEEPQQAIIRTDLVLAGGEQWQS